MNGERYAIEDYEFGRVVVNGRSYSSDLLILPESIHSHWWRDEGHALAIADLWELERLSEPPDVMIVGTGAHGRMQVLPETRRWLASCGIELREATTDAACRQYNQMLRQGRRVAAALHLTC